MRSLNLDQLRTLVSIVDLGSFSATAQALHLSQPTVSLHVSELESRLGVRLLDRSGRRAAATPTGAVLVERARQLLRDADEAADMVRRHAEGRVGRVRLGTSTVVVAHLLPRALDWLAREHPGIDVDLQILGSVPAAERLREGTLDLAIVSVPLPAATGLRLMPWRTDPMAAFIPPRWQAPRTVTPAWLARHPLVLNDSTTNMSRLTMGWFAQAGLAPRPRIELNYTEAIKSLVMAGYGASVLPVEQEVDPWTERGHLQVRSLRPALKRQLGLACRPGGDDDPAIAIVLEALGRLR